jgi:hypothetical protein
MKVPQIRIFHSEDEVNEWFKVNHHLEIVSVNLSVSMFNCTVRENYILVHFNMKAEESK